MMKKWAKLASAALLALSLSVTGFGVKLAEAAAKADAGSEVRMENNFWMMKLLQMYSGETNAVQTVQTMRTKSVDAPQSLTPTIGGMEYSKTLSVKASSYGPGNINWKYGGHTKSGTKVREGVISVDPSVIPLGTKVFVTGYSTELLPEGGFVATAEDTGGAIKGNRIDIYIDGTQTQLRQFGMQNVKLYVLK
jgi:3D (Asp-Asp-Asp) domain-containing protein